MRRPSAAPGQSGPAPKQETQGAQSADQGKAGLAELHPLAQRIAAFEIARETARQRLDGGDLDSQPHVFDLGDQRLATIDQLAVRRAISAMAPRRAGAARGAPSISTEAPMRGEDVQRQVDAIEAAVVLGAILKVVDDLQRRA